MIAFGSAMSDPEAYRRYARPGIQMAVEPDSQVYAFAAAGPISRGYNLLLDTAGAREDLEALVLVQEDVEIADRDFCRKARQALGESEVAVVGCAGATGVRGIAWWEGAVSAAPSIHRYHEHGGGDMPGLSWTHADPAPAEVDTLDGSLLVLSPWAVRNMRFDESLSMGYGFDLDFCLQTREAGCKLAIADLRVIRHHSLELVSDLDLWVEAHIKLAEKWDGRSPGLDAEPGSWKQRARRAEAEREAARTIAYSSKSRLEAQTLPLERRLEELTGSTSWRLTAPLRRVNRWLRERRSGRKIK